VVVGAGAAALRLEATALARFGVNKAVIRLTPELLAAGEIPQGLRETVGRVPVPPGAAAWALVCKGRSCLAPMTDAEELLAALEG